MNETCNYRAGQLITVDPSPGGKATIKIISSNGSTNWLDIEESEYKAIKALLLRKNIAKITYDEMMTEVYNETME